VLAVSAAVLLLAACQPRISTQEAVTRIRGLSDQHVRDSTTVEDDALDVVAVFSTRNARGFGEGPEGYNSVDEFLRGYIDKRTGKRRFELYWAARRGSLVAVTLGRLGLIAFLVLTDTGSFAPTDDYFTVITSGGQKTQLRRPCRLG